MELGVEGLDRLVVLQRVGQPRGQLRAFLGSGVFGGHLPDAQKPIEVLGVRGVWVDAEVLRDLGRLRRRERPAALLLAPFVVCRLFEVRLELELLRARRHLAVQRRPQRLGPFLPLSLVQVLSRGDLVLQYGHQRQELHLVPDEPPGDELRHLHITRPHQHRLPQCLRP